MKTYGVGQRRIGVYETGGIRPKDAVAVVAHEAAICFVDRIADVSGIIDAGAMTEAVARHRRLKMTPSGDSGLHFDYLYADGAPRLAALLRLWRSRAKAPC
jgi:hypothetical protein